MMIEKGADDWNWGLGEACKGRHKEIIKLMVKKGAFWLHLYVEYPRDKEIILGLIEIGVTKEQLKYVENIEELYKEMKKEVDDVLEEKIIKDIRNIIIKLIV